MAIAITGQVAPHAIQTRVSHTYRNISCLISPWTSQSPLILKASAAVEPPGDGQLSISLGGHEWVGAAVSGAIGLVAVPPVLLGTAYGIWKENRLGPGGLAGNQQGGQRQRA
jgi:hypothetical protein